MEKYYKSPAITRANNKRNIFYSIVASSIILGGFLTYRLTLPSQDIYLNNFENSSFIYASKKSTVLVNSSLEKNAFKTSSGLEDKLDFKESKSANSRIQSLEYIPIEIPE